MRFARFGLGVVSLDILLSPGVLSKVLFLSPGVLSKVLFLNPDVPWRMFSHVGQHEQQRDDLLFLCCFSFASVESYAATLVVCVHLLFVNFVVVQFVC